MGGKSAPTPDYRLGEAAMQSAQLGKDALAWYKEIYASDLKPQQQQALDMQKGLISDYMADRAQQRQFASDQNAYYEQTFKPIEQQAARDAMNYDSAENINRRQGIASAGVTQAFSNARASAQRNMERYGINPNSGAFAATNARLANQEALANAGARTGAAFDTMDKGVALRAGMANFGRNMTNTAAQYFGLANATGGQANAMASQGMADARANASMVGQGYATGLQGYGQAGNLWAQDFQGRMQGYQADQMALGSALSAVGGFAGYGMGSGWMMGRKPGGADGGEFHVGAGPVSGPGGPVDDLIDAKLSDGEYVLPADTVKAIGVKKLDALVKKTHTPAAIQRGLKRR